MTAEACRDCSLAGSEQRFRNLVQSSIQGIVIHRNDKVLLANQAMADMLGYDDPEELRQLNSIDEYVHPSDIARTRTYRSARLSGQKPPNDYEIRIVRRDRSSCWVNCRVMIVDWDENPAFQAVFFDITERKETEAALRESEARLATAQRIAHLGNWLRDYRTGTLEWSDEVFRIFGFEPKAFEPTKEIFSSAVHPDDREEDAAELQRAIETHTPYSIDHRIIRPDGEVRWVHQSGEIDYDQNGMPARTFGTIQDITERKLAEKQTLALIKEREHEAYTRQLAERERDEAMERLTEAIESISEGFAIWGADARLVMCNSKYLEVFRDLSDILVPGVHFERFLETAVDRGVYDPGELSVDEFIQSRLDEHCNPAGPFERRVGDDRWVRISKHRTDSGGVVGIWTDITERKEAEETIRDLAVKDALTGLVNRNGFQDCLADAIETAREIQSRVALLFLDLDRFKQVNDETGHPGGDALLKQVARRFVSLTRDSDIVARLGGDEFAIILTTTATIDTARQLAKRINDSLAQPFSIDGRDISSGTSIGISIFPDDDTNADGLIRKADMALYQAKNRGRGTYQLYDKRMHSAVRQTRALENELRSALLSHEFVLHYQPQFDITGVEVIGIEALLRWQHPDRGLLSPADFIDVAESSGLIVDIGKWVVAEACAQIKQWSGGGLPEVRVAVNLSARQFRSEDLVETIQAVLVDTGIDPRLLELEITESMVMHDIEQTTVRLSQLSQLGLDIAIDDFGTGYSSLAYLKQFPVQRLKIDRLFTGLLDAASQDTAIVDAIIRLGHSLGLKVTAEGVETSEQLAVLRNLGCDEVQGYFFVEPMQADALENWFEARPQPLSTELLDAMT